MTARTELPFPLVHIDTGHNYPEVIAFRDQRVAELGARLVVGHVEDSIKRGTVRLRKETDSRNAAQVVTLLETIEANQYDALMGGARRDEAEGPREGAHLLVPATSSANGTRRPSAPSCGVLYNARMAQGEQMRVFPISNWTELDVAVHRPRKLALPPIYYTHQREVVRKNGLLVPVTPITPKQDGDVSEVLSVRFRTVGDISCTCPVASTADSPEAIIAETAVTEITERGATRMDDQTSEASMERRKKEAPFLSPTQPRIQT
ncbi:sulfate adenylyltransferase subunit CysD [Cupriavidus basilensis]